MTLSKSLSLATYLTIVGLISYLLLSDTPGDLIEAVSSVPLFGYSTALFLLASVFLAANLYKNRAIVPSAFLFIFFLAVPIIGYHSYNIFIDLHGDFFGVQLSFGYPIFIWSLGTAVFFAGTLLPHLFRRFSKRPHVDVWDLRRTSRLLWFFLGLSLLATVVAVIKIGYIPVLHSGIDEIRQNYEILVGRHTARLSRLFVIAGSLATVLFFMDKPRRKLYFALYLISLFGAISYGERIYVFWTIAFFLLISLKFYKPTKRHILAFAVSGCCILLLFIVFGENRAGRIDEGFSLERSVVAPLFSEYLYYAFVVDEISHTGGYLEEDLFLGSLVLIFPRQIWGVFGIDKDYIMEKYTAVHHFGEWFNDRNGTRITPIGEAYAGYGITWGVCAQLFVLGLCFGLLERVFLNLHQSDVRLGFVCLSLSMLLWLPISTLSAIIDPMVFFGGILLVCQFYAAKRVPLLGKNERENS